MRKTATNVLFLDENKGVRKIDNSCQVELQSYSTSLDTFLVSSKMVLTCLQKRYESAKMVRVCKSR